MLAMVRGRCGAVELSGSVGLGAQVCAQVWEKYEWGAVG